MRFLFWTVIAIFGIVLLMRVFGKGGKVLSEADRVVQTLAMVLRFVMYGVGAFLVVKFAIYIFAPFLSSYDLL